jgi:hypothetical protein
MTVPEQGVIELILMQYTLQISDKEARNKPEQTWVFTGNNLLNINQLLI